MMSQPDEGTQARLENNWQYIKEQQAKIRKLRKALLDIYNRGAPLQREEHRIALTALAETQERRSAQFYPEIEEETTHEDTK